MKYGVKRVWIPWVRPGSGFNLLFEAMLSSMFVTEGKDALTLSQFKEDFEFHKEDTKAIEETCCGMALAFIAGVLENSAPAQINFDNFYVLKVLNEAVEKVIKK